MDSIVSSHDTKVFFGAHELKKIAKTSLALKRQLAILDVNRICEKLTEIIGYQQSTRIASELQQLALETKRYIDDLFVGFETLAKDSKEALQLSVEKKVVIRVFLQKVEDEIKSDLSQMSNYLRQATAKLNELKETVRRFKHEIQRSHSVGLVPSSFVPSQRLTMALTVSVVGAVILATLSSNENSISYQMEMLKSKILNHHATTPLVTIALAATIAVVLHKLKAQHRNPGLTGVQEENVDLLAWEHDISGTIHLYEALEQLLIPFEGGCLLEFSQCDGDSLDNYFSRMALSCKEVLETRF